MKKQLETASIIIDKLAITVSVVLLSVVVVWMLCKNSVYLYTDAPAFRQNNIYNYIGILLGFAQLLVLSKVGRWIEGKQKQRLIICCIFFLYIVLECIFILACPLKPFSDNLQVTSIAMSNMDTGIDYLQKFPNNIPTVLLFNLLFRIMGYSVNCLQLVNVACNVLTCIYAQKIYENIFHEHNILVDLLALTFLPTFFYVVSCYNDLIFTALSTASLYAITKEKKGIINPLIVGILLFLQYLIRPVGIILIFACIMYYILKRGNLRNALLIIFVTIFLSIGYGQLRERIVPTPEEKVEYPVWSFIQMGLNETEFGFQDGSHSTDWTAKDVQNRIVDLGPKRLIKLLVKKTIWIWTEGTYQVERYCFGIHGKEGFFYETPLTKLIDDLDCSPVRRALEYIMKGQYFAIMLCALLALLSNFGMFSPIVGKKAVNNSGIYSLLLYCVVGILCFYIIWEIKSRYIYCLYPVFVIFAACAIKHIVQRDSNFFWRRTTFRLNRVV